MACSEMDKEGIKELPGGHAAIRLFITPLAEKAILLHCILFNTPGICIHLVNFIVQETITVRPR